jgi:hypothetical protein
MAMKAHRRIALEEAAISTAFLVVDCLAFGEPAGWLAGDGSAAPRFCPSTTARVGLYSWSSAPPAPKRRVSLCVGDQP